MSLNYDMCNSRFMEEYKMDIKISWDVCLLTAKVIKALFLSKEASILTIFTTLLNTSFDIALQRCIVKFLFFCEDMGTHRAASP